MSIKPFKQPSSTFLKIRQNNNIKNPFSFKNARKTFCCLFLSRKFIFLNNSNSLISLGLMNVWRINWKPLKLFGSFKAKESLKLAKFNENRAQLISCWLCWTFSSIFFSCYPKSFFRNNFLFRFIFSYFFHIFTFKENVKCSVRYNL